MNQVRTRPLWQGVPRGAAIATMAVLDPPPKGDGRGFVEKLGDRVYNFANDSTAGVIGFLLVTGSLALAIAGLSATDSPALAALLTLMTITWIGACMVAGVLVYRDADLAPPWARALITVLIALGRLATIVAIIVTVIIVLYLILVIIASASSAGRSR